MELILEEVGHFEQQQKWQDALVAASRAEAALSVGETPEHLQAEVRETVAELQMVEHLEEIRLAASEIKEQKFNHEGASGACSVPASSQCGCLAARGSRVGPDSVSRCERRLGSLGLLCRRSSGTAHAPRPCPIWPRHWTRTAGQSCAKAWRAKTTRRWTN